MVDLTTIDKGGSVTWYLALAIVSFFGLGLLAIKGYQLIINGQLQVGVTLFSAAILFTLMGIGSFFIGFTGQSSLGSKLQEEFVMLQTDTPGELSISFFAGFLLFTAPSSLSNINIFSTLSTLVPKMPLSTTLSTAGQQLTNSEYLFINGVVAPPVEALFFGAALPIITLGVLDILVETDLPIVASLSGNRLFQVATILLVSASAFATFHVSQPVLSGFWIAAFSFAVIVRGLSYTDIYFNTVPGFGVLGGFIIGAHMGNNFNALGGVVTVFQGLAADPLLFLMTVSLFVIYGLSALGRVLEVVN